MVCITNPVKLSTNGTPKCQNNTANVNGKMSGTDGSVQVAQTTGFTATSTFTVESSSTIGTESTLSATIGIPDEAGVTASFTMSTEVTNTNTKSFSPSYNNAQTITVTYNSKDGKKCVVNQTTQTCTLQATGKVQYLASGWVWFNYNDQTKGHYKWAASIEGVLTNPADRSSYATIGGSIESKTHSQYAANCDKA
jgi:hypothetical protein